MPDPISPDNVARQKAAQSQTRDTSGHFIKTPNGDPPMVNLQVTNPVTYLKLWWKKIMSQEGIDFRFRIHPVTAIIIVSIVALGGFGIGRVSVFSYIPVLGKLIPTPVPSATAEPTNDWQDSALTGILKVTPNTNKYYLLTNSSQAVSLQFASQIDLNKYLGKRILASGSYNSKTHVLIISDILDLEVLPASPVPIVTPVPTITPEPTSLPN